jgi:hypothetical protein
MITRLARAAGHRRIRLRILAGTVRTAAAARQETGSRHHAGMSEPYNRFTGQSRSG